MASACTRTCVFDNSSDPLDFKTPESALPSGQTRIPRSFTITTDSYISLCSRVYAACCTTYNDFEDIIPESAFQYYAVILVWKRFGEILSQFSESKPEFFAHLDYINTSSLYIPIPMQSYLKGIGHFRDPDGCDRQFVLPVLPKREEIAGIPYTFGKVNADSNFFYEAFPAPGIAALRMLADINYTDNCGNEDMSWDLPEGLRPDVNKAIKPTKNLLGWAPPNFLSHKQYELFKSTKIDDKCMQNNFLTSDKNIEDLFKRISSHLSYAAKYSTREIFGISAIKALPFMGSLTQGVTVLKHGEFLRFDRSAMYCDGTVSVSSPYKLNGGLNKGAVISGYRMAKEPISERHCWSCYDFIKFKSVPDLWIDTRNTIYTYGSVGRLNEAVYTTAHVTKRILQNECIHNTMIKRKEKWSIHL